ncbi:MAG: hypothetical protein US89_C0007G0014 [Candidatus Peregrinibacteria bacterium GW2011_GWF2_38_29]|nr:MAG: hypothetical protein US89_C0007G0014 [Candidatus Peregrinibacteria bacterium GW2011_GWF2_38_29]HBB02832.1 hypothetical protein [Candidatus Peregrinibacteria bacterium]
MENCCHNIPGSGASVCLVNCLSRQAAASRGERLDCKLAPEFHPDAIQAQNRTTRSSASGTLGHIIIDQGDPIFD